MPLAASSPFKLQNIQAGVRVGKIHQAVSVHEAIGRLDHLRPVRPRIEHARGIGRHIISNLARLKCVLDVEHADARVVIGRENVPRALEGAWPVFPKIVDAEISAFGSVVSFRRNRQGRNTDRIFRHAHVEYPAVA